MKLRNVSAGIVLCLTMVSCIQDEALNVEAAIDGCSGTNIQLSTINPSSKTASIYVSKSTDLSALEIKFTLPDGASIEPVNAIANDAPPKYDFSTSQIPITPEQTLEQYQRKFRVTSESETTEAVYTITVIKSELPTNFHFENLVDGSSDYHELYEFNQQQGETLQWASGNPGFKLTGMAKSPFDYPTLQTEGYIGKGIRLETKSTGDFGEKVKIHRTNVDSHNRIMCFDIRDLGNQLKEIGMLIVQDAVWNRVSQNRERKVATRYYCDEFHLLLKEKQTAIYSVEIWKRFRKWGGIPTGLTQNVGDFLKSEEIEGILGNSDFVYLLNQNAKDQHILADKLGLSEKQLMHVTNSEPGSGLILFDNVVIPFVDKYPADTKTYAIMNTKPEESVKKEDEDS